MSDKWYAIVLIGCLVFGHLVLAPIRDKLFKKYVKFGDDK